MDDWQFARPQTAKNSSQSHVRKVFFSKKGDFQHNYRNRQTKRRMSNSYEEEEDVQFDDESVVHVDKLDMYLEMLYSQDDFVKKVKGSFFIMQLSRNPDNLEYLITNEILLNALGRELKEEGKKSMDLMVNILYVFYSFSHFSQFHQVITKFKVGGIVMKTVSYEERRYEELISRRKQLSAANQQQNIPMLRKIERMLEKQERLLYVCFHILLNLAEDINLEMKMMKKNIVSSLTKCFERRNPDLLVLIVMFLKKLSIFEENKAEMLAIPGMFPKLVNLLTQPHLPLRDNCMRLLVNLSFDRRIRDIMLDTPNFLPLCVKQLTELPMLESTVKVLYQLSVSDRGKATLGQTQNLLPIILGYIVNYPGTRVNKELMALGINLVQDPRNVDILIGEPQANGTPPINLQNLMDRLIKTHDPLLGKMIRNISTHDKQKGNFLPYIQGLISICTAHRSEESEMVVEALGVLGNMNNLKGYSFIDCFKKLNIVDFVLKHLQNALKASRENPKEMNSDLYLEIVVLVGTVTCDSECARIIATSPIITVISQLLLETMYDGEFVLQILYSFYRFLLFEPTRRAFIQQKHILLGDKRGILTLLLHNNEEIRRVVNLVCDLVMDYDAEWREHVKRTRFYIHNREWCEFIEQEEKGITAA